MRFWMHVARWVRGKSCNIGGVVKSLYFVVVLLGDGDHVFLGVYVLQEFFIFIFVVLITIHDL